MHKCLPRDATHSAVFAVVWCGVRLFVTLMYRNGQTYYQTFSSHGGPIILVSDGGNPQQGRQIEVGYQKFAIFNQYFRNIEYRGISKYRYQS